MTVEEEAKKLLQQLENIWPKDWVVEKRGFRTKHLVVIDKKTLDVIFYSSIPFFDYDEFYSDD